MPKGKPWTREQEQTLIKLVGRGKAVDVIAKVLGKTENAVYIKVRRLGLRVEEDSETNQLSSSSPAKLPGELPSIENVMKRLSAALSALEQPGIVTRYDAIVLDEVQSMKGDSAGEVIAGLRVYLESGRFSRGKTMGTSECGFVMMGNISLEENRKPIHVDDGLFNEIPNFLRETAFIDRIHGLISGWDLPRVTKDTPSRYLGFKGDFFSEILHLLRKDVRFADYVSINMQLENCQDLRDRKAITRLATGFMKLLFPSLGPTHEDFVNYCVKPAVELRQRVRDELHKMDPEYPEIAIGVPT